MKMGADGDRDIGSGLEIGGRDVGAVVMITTVITE